MQPSNHWVFLSPHPDDVALSCGGMVWELSRVGKVVEVWTICCGDPPPGPLSPFAEAIHRRWETGDSAPAHRRTEDLESCVAMGARARQFQIPDCIYRRSPTSGEWFHGTNESLFSELHPEEGELIRSLMEDFNRLLPANAQLVCPLCLGGHVDHRLTRAAAELTGFPIWYYADYLYVLKNNATLENYRRQGWKETIFPVSEAGLEAWSNSVAAHRSQISTFWPDLQAMKEAIRSYWQEKQGVVLWKAPETDTDLSGFRQISQQKS